MKRLLIVDDHEVVRESLANALEGLGWDIVGTASNGEEAVSLCRELQPDVILMDIVMPRMDGITATRLIHTQCPMIWIVILTMNSNKETEQAALQAGAARLLQKHSLNEICQTLEMLPLP
jgi:NarL family two-component system response regulator LiaR